MPNNKCGVTMMWYKNFIKNLIFDLYMLFIGFFRLIICKAVSKEVYGIQKSLRGNVYTQLNMRNGHWSFFVDLTTQS